MEAKSRELAYEKVSLKELRSFGILMGSVFSIVSLVLFLKGLDWWCYGFGSVALLLFIFAFWIPLSLNIFYRKWMRFAEVIGVFNMKLILGFVYLICFSFLGFVFRIIGKDPMKRKFDAKTDSYWVEHEVHGSNDGLKRYERQY